LSKTCSVSQLLAVCIIGVCTVVLSLVVVGASLGITKTEGFGGDKQSVMLLLL